MKTRKARSTETAYEPSLQSRQTPAPGSMAEQIAIAAYFKAEARNFEPGHELEDWLAAEAEVQ